MATSGPGATNLVTGIATAYMDSVPMVAITANVTLPLLGKDSFQEVDIAGVTMPITKHGYIVKNVEILADTIRIPYCQKRQTGPCADRYYEGCDCGNLRVYTCDHSAGGKSDPLHQRRTDAGSGNDT